MRHLTRLGFVLGPLFALACAAPHADSTHAPETSRSAADSSAPTDGTAGASDPNPDSDPGPTTEPLARRPPLPPPPRPVDRRPAPSPYPYRVEILGDSGGHLATFHQTGRTYVLGSLGERYTVHVTNPTARRVEAVISVDGLDAIDGNPADFAHKSGYVIAPYGDLTVDGFRTSMQDVATFRFSSVRDSYASREGHARNVGVIGVAFFPERPLPPPPPPEAEIAPRPSRAPAKHASSGYDSEQSLKDMPSDDEVATASPPSGAAAGAGGGAPAATAAPAAPAPRRERSGLGTEFGEQRTSVVQYIDFQRADATHPSAMAEIRYNDRNGLLALGIPLAPPRPSEIGLRETASPFPMNQFASPPPPEAY